MLQVLAESLEVDIPIDEEHHLLWSVVTTYKPQGIGSSVGTQLRGITKDVMAQGMTFEQQVLELVIDQFGRRVVVALDFIADHFYFFVDLMLRILAMKHDVGKHIDSLGEVFLGDSSIINGIFLVGEGIEFPSQPFDGIYDLDGKAAYAHRFINFEDQSKAYPFLTDNGEMLIICADPYVAGMEEFVAWKNISGRPTTLVSVTEAGGNSDTQIKNYINSYYTNPDHNLAFVLLVGDYADLTPHNLGSERSDNWFGQLEGTDHYPEVFVGRFSVQTDAQLATHVNKVLNYERDVESSITWGDRGLGIGCIGAGSGHYGEDDYQHIDYIRDTLMHYTYTTVTELHGGGGGASTTSISNAINQGVGIINYCNHGSETSWGVANYSTSNVHALTNDYMLPIVWSVACLNGKFNYGTECFAEAWMRATDNANGNPTGAIGGMLKKSFCSFVHFGVCFIQNDITNLFSDWCTTWFTSANNLITHLL